MLIYNNNWQYPIKDVAYRLGLLEVEKLVEQYQGENGR